MKTAMLLSLLLLLPETWAQEGYMNQGPQQMGPGGQQMRGGGWQGRGQGQGQGRGQGRMGKGGRGGKMKQLLEQLNLTEEQREKIKGLRESRMGEGKSNREEIKKLREELKSKMESNAPKESILSLYDQVESKQASMKRGKFAMILDIREVLTPEQREQFQAAMKERRGNRGRGGQQGQRGPRGQRGGWNQGGFQGGPPGGQGNGPQGGGRGPQGGFEQRPMNGPMDEPMDDSMDF